MASKTKIKTKSSSSLVELIAQYKTLASGFAEMAAGSKEMADDVRTLRACVILGVDIKPNDAQQLRPVFERVLAQLDATQTGMTNVGRELRLMIEEISA